MASLCFFGFYAIFLYNLEYVQSCDYEFANLDSSLSVDWSTGIGSVIYTVKVTKLPEDVITTDVLIQIDLLLTQFKLNEANIYQVLVKGCLEHERNYNVVIKIMNDTNCPPGTLSVTTMSATPHFNKATTTFTVIPDEDPFNPFTEAFIVEITNDYAFGGCGSFTCTALCTNDGNQHYLVDVDTKVMSVKWLLITKGFLYKVEVTCFDTFDGSFLTDDHSFNADITFVLTMPTPEPTTTTAIAYASTTTNTALNEPTAGTTLTSVTRKTTSPQQTMSRASKLTSFTATPSESAELTTSVSSTRQISRTSITLLSTKLETSKTTISAVMSLSNTTLYSRKTTTQKLIATSILLEQITSVKQHSEPSTHSTRTGSNLPSPSAISGPILTTAPATNYKQVYTDVFNKPGIIVTFVLPAFAFSVVVLCGIVFVIYKKVLNKSSITPVNEL